MPAPTRVSYNAPASGNFSTVTTPKTTGSFAVQAGDLIVVLCSVENAASLSTVTPSASGGAVTWTLRASQTAGTQNQSAAYCWTGVVGTTAASITVTLARPTTSNILWWGFSATVFRSHGGVGVTFSGTSGTGSGAPSVAASCSANSAVVCQINDWNAADGTTRTWRSINGAAESESAYFRDASRHTVYGGFRTDTGVAGTVTQGLTAPSGQRWVLVGVEVLGTASAGTTYPAAGTVPATTATTASAVARLVAAGVLAATTTVAASAVARLGASGTVAASSTATGAATVLRPTSGTVAATSTVAGAADRLGQSFPAAGTVAATSDTTGSASVRAAAAGTVGATSTTTAAAVARLGAAGTAAATTTVAGTASVLGGPVAHPAAGVVAVVSTTTGAVRLRAGAAGVTPVISATSATAGLRATAAGTAPAVTTTTGSVGSLYRVGGTVVITSENTGSADIALSPDELPVVEVGAMQPARYAAAAALPTLTATADAPRYLTGQPLPQRYTRRP